MIESQMMQGEDWNNQDPTGMVVTEKFKGCRGEWDGERLWSKNGNEIPAPAWFTAGLPRRFRLSGEIFAGYCEVETAARTATQYGHFIRGTHTFIVFDCPSATGGILQRIEAATLAITWGPRQCIEVVPAYICTGLDDLINRLEAVQQGGGEGIMLHRVCAPWQAGRTSNLFKVKSLAALLAAKKFQLINA
jgi:DNA ligase-1